MAPERSSPFIHSLLNNDYVSADEIEVNASIRAWEIKTDWRTNGRPKDRIIGKLHFQEVISEATGTERDNCYDERTDVWVNDGGSKFSVGVSVTTDQFMSSVGNGEIRTGH